MGFIDQLLENGGNFAGERSEMDALFRPSSDRDAALHGFQALVGQLRARDGDGYRIRRQHLVAGSNEDLVGLVEITIDPKA